MKILVTGGCGFIGSNFIRYYLKKYPKDTIINLDKLTYAGHMSSTKDFSSSKNYFFVKGDICDHDLVYKITKDVDFIIHFAAETHVDRSIHDPSLFIRTNVLGTQVLLEAALKNKIKRFHHVSTDEVFGSLSLKTKKRFNEKTPYNPRNPYSASKAASDFLVRAYHYTYGLDITITNTSNNFGPFQDPEKFIPRAITNLLEGKKIVIYGKGENIRDWIYVLDHVRAIDLVLKRGKSGETYLVGGLKKDLSNLDVARKILLFLGKDESFIEFVKDRPGHDLRYSIDSKKIEKELGWKPKYNFDKGLRKTIKWYKENRWWWEPLKKESEKFYQKIER